MPRLKREDANCLVVDANGGADASPGAAVGSNFIRHVRLAEIPPPAGRAVGDDDLAVTARLVEAAPGPVFSEERQLDVIVSHTPGAHAAEMLTNLRDIPRRDKNSEEILNSAESPRVICRAVTSRHA